MHEEVFKEELFKCNGTHPSVFCFSLLGNSVCVGIHESHTFFPLNTARGDSFSPAAFVPNKMEMFSHPVQ